MGRGYAGRVRGSPRGRSCPAPAAAARDTGTPEGAVSLEGRPLQPRGGGLRQLSTGSESVVQSKDGMITSSVGSGRVCVCVCVCFVVVGVGCVCGLSLIHI